MQTVNHRNSIGIQKVTSIIQTHFLLLTIILLFNGCEYLPTLPLDEVNPQPGKNIVTFIENENDLSEFDALIKQTGLDTEIENFDRLTILAPTNAAMKASGVNPGFLPNEELKQFLQYYLIDDVIFKQDFDGGILTENGNKLFFSQKNNLIYINGKAKIETANYVTTNGLVHKIDRILIAPENPLEKVLGINPSFSLFQEAISEAGLIDSLKQMEGTTILAPTNLAFKSFLNQQGYQTISQIPNKMLITLVKYHLLNGYIFSQDFTNQKLMTRSGYDIQVREGNGLYFNGVSVSDTSKNILATNGVVHAVQNVLIPPPGNLSQLFGVNPGFITFNQLINAANLNSELQGEGPFTVFAPGEEAFNALSDSIKSDLLDSLKTETAKQVVLSHVFNGNIFSSDLSSGENKLVSLSGDSLSVFYNSEPDSIWLKDKNNNVISVKQLNLVSTNGVVHEIEEVILP